MELVVINSYGPMGTSVVGSILEKFGYINLPIRKRKLEDYVLGKKEIQDTYFKNRTLELFNNLSKGNNSGGTGVLDRNKNSKQKKLDINLVKFELEHFTNKNYSNLEDMYFDSMIIANKATIYKKKIKNVVGSIELATNLEKVDNKKLYEFYKKKFNKVKFINLNREFVSWLNSLLSQKLLEKNRSLIPNIVKLSSRKRDYDNYLKDSLYYDSLDLSFEDIFIPNTLNTIKKIEYFLKKNISKVILENEYFDLYGAERNFMTTFTKADDNINYISKLSKLIASKTNSHPNLLIDILFQFSYIIDYLTIKNRIKK